MVITKIKVSIFHNDNKNNNNIFKSCEQKMLLPSSIIIGVALLVVVSISIINGVPSAAALEQIHASHDVSAPVDRIWNIISNLGNDTTWNQANTMKIIRKTGNEIQDDEEAKSSTTDY